MSTFRRLIALLAALGLFFAACGDDDDVNTDDPAGQVEDEVDDTDEMDDMDDGGSEDDMESEDEMDDMESEDDMGDEEMESDDEMEEEGDS